MICKVCGNNFDEEKFTVCPYCLTPVNASDSISDIKIIEESKDETDESNKENTIASNNNSAVDTDSEQNIYSSDKDDTVDVLSEGEDVSASDEDTISERDQMNYNISILQLDLSTRATNILRRYGIDTLKDLIDFQSTNDVSNLKNAGKKTVGEIYDVLKKISVGDYSVIKKDDSIISDDDNIIDETVNPFENISSDVDSLSISALSELGAPNRMASKLCIHNINYCGELRKLSNAELSDIIGRRYIDKISELRTLLGKDITFLLNYVLNNHKGTREYETFLRRSRGETLQEIASNPDNKEDDPLTRERVRQLENKMLNAILPFVISQAYVLEDDSSYIAVQSILGLFNDEEYSQIILYALKESEEFEFLDFADKFVDKKKKRSVEQCLIQIIKEIIGQGADLLEVQDNIEDALSENNFDFIEMSDILSLLRKNHYSINGTFAFKGKNKYVIPCLYIIQKQFPDGIKLSESTSEQSEDLISLRKTVNEKYPGTDLPKSDRAISSTLVKNGLVLCGRGTYISQENIKIDDNLLEEIVNYIDNKKDNKIFYNEIFVKFQGPLNIICGVDNYNYLHGILALKYPDSYEYFKDYLLKKNGQDGQRESIADRIYDFICEMGRAVSKQELFQEFEGFSNIMLTMPFMNDRRLLQWEYNYFSCTGILNISDQDKKDLKECIRKIFKENQNYASEALLFEEMKKKNPHFLEKNKIKSKMNLFYITSKLFSGEFKFRRPHIAAADGPETLSLGDIILFLLNYPDKFTYNQCLNIFKKMKWAIGSFSSTLAEFENDYHYAKISSDEYLKNNLFDASEEIVLKVKHLIDKKTKDGIYPLMNVDFDDFPEMDYPWNEFMLESFIKKYIDSFDIVQPSVRDHRYQRGIAVKKILNLKSYDQVVAYKMNLDGYEKMSESHFLSYLILNDLAKKVIPNELDNSDYIKKENGYYYVIKKS